MSQSNTNSHEVEVTFTDVNELDRLIKQMKTDPYISMTSSIKKFETLPYKYDYWYSKSKESILVANKDGKLFDLIDRLLKTYDKISDN